MSNLSSAVAKSPEHNSFQLKIVGNCSHLTGRAEHLRLITLQQQLLQGDGRIRYLNTAGFAIRRSLQSGKIFDSRAQRGEDTMLLSDLIAKGELPLFIGDAIVEHGIPMSVMRCLVKDVSSALIEANTYDIIASKGIQIRMSQRERLSVLVSMWRASRDPSIGYPASLVAVARQALQRMLSLTHPLLRRLTVNTRRLWQL
ncbi:MAG: hypothetical protein JO266_10500 [Acidobacteria bacterium]|nr:hypothetical protein [Acidobacteriota bacterium]